MGAGGPRNRTTPLVLSLRDNGTGGVGFSAVRDGHGHKVAALPIADTVERCFAWGPVLDLCDAEVFRWRPWRQKSVKQQGPGYSLRPSVCLSGAERQSVLGK